MVMDRLPDLWLGDGAETAIGSNGTERTQAFTAEHRRRLSEVAERLRRLLPDQG
jgi:hypothetical protein